MSEPNNNTNINLQNTSVNLNAEDRSSNTIVNVDNTNELEIFMPQSSGDSQSRSDNSENSNLLINEDYNPFVPSQIRERSSNFFNTELPLYSNYIRRRNANRFAQLNNFRNMNRGIYNPFINTATRTESAANPTTTVPNNVTDFSNFSLDFDFMPSFETEDTTTNNIDNCFRSILSNSTRRVYGNLTILTFEKLIKNKLINKTTLISERIYKIILDVYLFNFNFEKNNKKSMFKLTKLFIKSLPSLKFIEKFIKKIKFNSEKQKRNIYFIKLCLDIYEDFFKFFDYPLFNKFRNIYLKVVLDFYTKISDDGYKFVNEQISEKLKNINLRTFELKTKNEILEYYLNDRIEFRLLHDGLDNSKFIIK